MTQSKLDDLLDLIYESIDNIHQNYRTEYDLARHDYRMEKLDQMLIDKISDADKKRLNKLEKTTRERHKKYCDAIKNVHDVVGQAMGRNDIDNVRLNELKEILNELPECPPESDFLEITDIDDDDSSSMNDDDDDEIMISSDSIDDEVIDEVSFDENEARNLSLLVKVVEKSKDMKMLEAELKEYELMKAQSKLEMFELRDQQLDTAAQQQLQRDLFNKMNELKISYRRAKAEVRGMLYDIMPNLNDDTIGRDLKSLLERIEAEDAIEKSQASKAHQSSKLPQMSSKIPKTTTQASSNIPRTQIPSRIPTGRPQTPSKIPQMPSRLPQLSSTLPSMSPRIPQISKAPAEMYSIHQPRPLSQQIRSPQVQKTQIPRQLSAMKIPRAGNLPIPRQMGHSMAGGERRPMEANLKIAESMGNIHKVRARPTPASSAANKPKITASRGQISRIQPRKLTPAQRRAMEKQKSIKVEDSATRLLNKLDKDLDRLALKQTGKKRSALEKEELQSFIDAAVKFLFKKLEDDELSHEQKLKMLEEKLKVFLSEVTRILKKFRGKSYLPDESANQQYIQSIINHFDETKSFENHQAVLTKFFKKLPHQIPASQKPLFSSTPVPPARPSTARPNVKREARAAPSQTKRPSTIGTSKSIQSKVESQVKNLKKSALQKSSTQAAIKQKLDKFVDGFCKIFIMNQKNRRNSFDIWVKTFRDNIRPILNDLDAFYKTLPFPELQKFNREQVEQSLDRLLHQVYGQTRKYELTNVRCKDLIGNEMKKLMEQKQLKNLNESLGIFLQGIKELIESYVDVPLVQQATTTPSSSIIPKSSAKRRPQSMRQRVHETNIQRALHQTLMNETDDSIEYPSFNESILQQVSMPELQAMYRKMLRGKYQIPNIQGTASQAMMLERIEKILRTKVERGMARSRDESFLYSRSGRNQLMTFPIHERIAPSSINIFKRVIGANEILDSLEPTDEMLKALDILLESCEMIDENICKVLTSRNPNEMSALDESLNTLVAHIKNLVYNNNLIDYGDEIARVDKLRYKVDVDELKSKLGRRTFTKADCEHLLDNVYSIQVNVDDEMYVLVEFIKNLRYLQYKYMLKILKGEIRGDTHQTPIISEASHVDVSISKAYQDKIKTVQPIRVVNDYNYPHDLIERDILYVACQLTNRNDSGTADEDSGENDDSTGHMDYLSRFIIQIAKKYQNNSINERDALRIVGQIFYMLPCIPISFYQTFIYHADNEYFSAINFNKPTLNTAARIEVMAMKNRTLCAEDKLLYGRQVTQITDQIERFMFVFDNEIEEIARSFKMLDIRGRNNVKISGNEISRTSNSILGNPKAIDTKDALDGKIDNVQITLVANQAPTSNVANEEILKKLDEIEAILDKHLQERDHFENSKIAKVALKYELQPNAIRRKNYWQCRGTEIPKWFPGFYAVFPNTNLTKPIAYSIDEILPHAWRMMAPINYK